MTGYLTFFYELKYINNIKIICLLQKYQFNSGGQKKKIMMGCKSTCLRLANGTSQF